METYFKIFTVVLPVFSLIALGYFLAYRNIVKKSSNIDIAKFIGLIALPIMVFTYLIRYPADIILSIDYILAVMAVLLLCYGIILVAAHPYFNNNSKETAFQALLSTYANTAYMGLPICIFTFGDEAIVPAILFACTLTIMGYAPSILICQWEDKIKSNKISIKDIEFSLLRHLYTHPLFYAPILAYVWKLIDVSMPPMALQSLEMISKTMIPLSLISIGISLYFIRKEDIKNIPKNKTNQSIIISLSKLLLMPIVAYGILKIVTFPDVWEKTFILQAAMPCSIGAYSMARKYNLFIKESGAVIMYSIIGASVSLPILLGLLL